MPTLEEVRNWRVDTFGTLAAIVDGQADRVETRVLGVQAGMAVLGSWWGPASISALRTLEQRRTALVECSRP